MPWLPAAYLVLFSIGLLGPAIYCAVKKLPYSIGVIWTNAKGKDYFAKAVIATYLMLAFLSIDLVIDETGVRFDTTALQARYTLPHLKLTLVKEWSTKGGMSMQFNDQVVATKSVAGCAGST